MKAAADISGYDGEAPEWFKAGVDAPLHAPTAKNKMEYAVKGGAFGRLLARKALWRPAVAECVGAPY